MTELASAIIGDSPRSEAINHLALVSLLVEKGIVSEKEVAEARNQAKRLVDRELKTRTVDFSLLNKFVEFGIAFQVCGKVFIEAQRWIGTEFDQKLDGIRPLEIDRSHQRRLAVRTATSIEVNATLPQHFDALWTARTLPQ